MKELVRMVVVLSAITALSGLILSGLKTWTNPIIEEQVLTYVQGPALKQIFLHNANDPIADRKKLELPDGRTVIVFPALHDGKLTAVAIEGAGKGYGGNVNVMTGFNINTDKLTGISITTHKETPGLGSRVAEPGFTKQFKGRAPAQAQLKRDGGDIDAISGATFSSIGVAEAVKHAATEYATLKDTIKATWQ